MTKLKTEVEVIKDILRRAHKEEDIKDILKGITAALVRMSNIEELV